jgi:DNA-directed RNA polymerase specialized sigma24 family protein
LPAPRRAAIAKNRYESVDWTDLWRRLYLHAVKLTRGINTVIDCGVSADDLVEDTLMKFWRSPNGLGWRENKGPLHVFLGRMLQNSFIDHIRRDKKIVRPEAQADAPSKQVGYDPQLTEVLALKIFQTELLKLVKGRKDEQELADFILAASLITSGGKPNQQLADILETDENDVISRRERVLRVAGVKELREGFRDGREGNKGSDKSDRPTAG